MRTWIEDFERAAISRNPDLTRKLQPGLSEARVKRGLDRAKVIGEVSPLIALYTWRNGTDLSLRGEVDNRDSLEAEKGRMSFFRSKPYYFPCFEMALGHFETFTAIAKNYPKISEAVGRYFPIFWDGSTERIAVDLKPLNRNRVLIVDHRSERGIWEVYRSFEDFVTDAIRANSGNKPLSCIKYA
jgi:hypothetical protein